MTSTERRQLLLAVTGALLLHAWVLFGVRIDRRTPVSRPQPLTMLLAPASTAPAQTQPRKLADTAAVRSRHSAEAAAHEAPPATGPVKRSEHGPAAKQAAAARPPAPPPAADAAPPARATDSARAPAEQARAAYEQLLAGWIDRYKTYPAFARRRREQGTGAVRVRIARSGRLIEERLDQSTRHPALDRAALEAVRRAAPFPPLPEQLDGEEREFLVPFVFTID
ncbi:MAG: energy transducer TonB [Deltaproteobacteria bacterium]|nr:MAG: energy transducer TonB [Deltaproteobacteria bacterium]